ncbi:MAG: glycoside hydrolase family 3 C-terminal domain-containing protein [Candidatus Latescibacteria bacterium]|nr:glycoside hydrolase family 3 C-terminal domain-containing protein [Candidatus Latescibacterota bacterium]
MPKIILIILSLSVSFALCIGAQSTPAYKNPSLTVEQRVEDLLGRMTVGEKVAQLINLFPPGLELENKTIDDVLTGDGIGGVTRVDVFSGRTTNSAHESAKIVNEVQKKLIENTRLGIPAIIHNEALHGLTAKGATSFPQAIGLAATFDDDLMKEVATAIARETQASGYRQVLSPVVNIARDVRWGRTQETYGEDPYLTSRMGVAYCKSFTDLGIITTPKHFVANFGDGGRDSNAIHFSERLLNEIYFPAFKACIIDGGALSVMPAFNSVDGRPCNASRWLLTDILRNEWGFEGFTVCDYDALIEVITLHKTATTKKEAAAQALSAGLDRELPAANVYGDALIEALRKGLVSEADLDASVRRILWVKFRLGLFDNPYVDTESADRVYNTPEHRALALKAARESIVLLKNSNDTLPLKKNLKKIAVIGADADVAKLGSYSGHGMETVSILQGIKNIVPAGTAVVHETGTSHTQYMLPTIPADHFFHEENDTLKPGLQAEYFNNTELEGDPVVVRIDENIGFEWGSNSPDPKINHDFFSARWTGKLKSPVTGVVTLSLSGSDGVRFWFDNELLFQNWNDRGFPTDLIKVRLEKGKMYDIRLEYYEGKWGADMYLGWDLGFEEQECAKMAKAAAVARSADAAVVVTSIEEGEFRDRASLDLPGFQEELIKEIAATATPTIVVLVTGSAVSVTNWISGVGAVVEAWYPGEEGGNAVAEVLFGDYNPGGRLPITFPRFAAQLPLYYNYKPSGRGYDYMDTSAVPLYPFGYGLSYTTFSYGELRIDKESVQQGKPVNIEVDIKNTGSVPGDEIVQLYLNDMVASVSRPVKELKGFRRITLDPGETKTVRFTLTEKEMLMLNEDMHWVVELGDFRVMVGSSSEDIRSEAVFTVIEK